MLSPCLVQYVWARRCYGAGLGMALAQDAMANSDCAKLWFAQREPILVYYLRVTAF
ncbi:hypothetical protein D3C78_1896300 [compost metagenome]